MQEVITHKSAKNYLGFWGKIKKRGCFALPFLLVSKQKLWQFFGTTQPRTD